MSRYYRRYGPSFAKIRKVVKRMWFKQGWSRVSQHNTLGTPEYAIDDPRFTSIGWTTQADYTYSTAQSLGGINTVPSAYPIITGTAAPTQFIRGGTRYIKNFKFRWSLMDRTPHPQAGGVDIDMSFVMAVYRTPTSDSTFSYEALANHSSSAVLVGKKFFEYHDTATGQGVITSNGSAPIQRWLEISVPYCKLTNEDLVICLYCIRNNSMANIYMIMDYNYEYSVKGTAVQG